VIDALAARFRRFAERECRGSSPLYERLAMAIAGDGEMLALAGEAPSGQPTPNLFLAAVHFLLLGEAVDARAPLARFYPSLTETPAAPEGAFVAFREFCRAHAGAVRRLLGTRRVQTNEVGRCAYLFPAFVTVAREAGDAPLALVEIGCSAGLNLMWDRYGYRYGDGASYGDPRSPVQLACELHGADRPPLTRRAPRVGLAVGVDLAVPDVDDPDDTRWLVALVWPEHHERRAALRGAIDIARAARPRVVTGDGLARLPELLDAVPAGMTACVFHTHTINQLTPEARERLAALLAAHGARRDLYRVSAEWLDGPDPRLELVSWRAGRPSHRVLGSCHPHGRWLRWEDRPA
jgi:hypothetical protein